MLLGNLKKKDLQVQVRPLFFLENSFQILFLYSLEEKTGKNGNSTTDFTALKSVFRCLDFVIVSIANPKWGFLNPLNPDFLFERTLGRNWVSKDWIASCPISRIRGPFLPGLACPQTPATQLGYSRSCTKRCKKGFCSSDLALELVVSRLCVNLPFFYKEFFV